MAEPTNPLARTLAKKKKKKAEGQPYADFKDNPFAKNQNAGLKATRDRARAQEASPAKKREAVNPLARTLEKKAAAKPKTPAGKTTVAGGARPERPGSYPAAKRPAPGGARPEAPGSYPAAKTTKKDSPGVPPRKAKPLEHNASQNKSHTNKPLPATAHKPGMSFAQAKREGREWDFARKRPNDR